MKKTLEISLEIMYNLIFVLLGCTFITMAEAIMPDEKAAIKYIMFICAALQGIICAIRIYKINESK